MLLDSKVIAVTGAASGIGRAIAIGCARHGADVALFDQASAVAVTDEIAGLGRRSFAMVGDVADPASATAFIAQTHAALGPLDGFVSNAGICPFHGFLDMPVDLFERTARVNLHGAYWMVQAAARNMAERGQGGAIVAMSSISALVGGAMQTHYTPTKAGVLSLMQSAAVALGAHGIRCNALLPGLIETALNQADLADEEKRERLSRRIPLGRPGNPEDLVGPAVFLLSDLARYVTGAGLLVDGGMLVDLQ